MRNRKTVEEKRTEIGNTSLDNVFSLEKNHIPGTTFEDRILYLTGVAQALDWVLNKREELP